MRSVHALEELQGIIGCVTCPICDADVTVDGGIAPVEALWLHEYECPALLMASDGLIHAAA